MNVFSLTRPKIQLPSIVSFLVGLALTFFLNDIVSLSLFKVLIGLLIVGPLVGGGSNIINQYYDYEIDKESEKSSPLIQLGIQKEKALVAGVLFLVLAIVISPLINLQALFLTLLGILISLAYHTPPIRLKSVKYLDSISNGVAYSFLPILLAWSIYRPITYEIPFLPLPALLGFTAGHMLLAIPDIEHDKKYSVNSTASVLGFERTVTLSILLISGMFALIPIEIYLGFYPLISLISLLPAPFILHQLFKLKEDRKKLRSVFEKLRIGGFLPFSLLFVVSILVSIAF